MKPEVNTQVYNVTYAWPEVFEMYPIRICHFEGKKKKKHTYNQECCMVLGTIVIP